MHDLELKRKLHRDKSKRAVVLYPAPQKYPELPGATYDDEGPSQGAVPSVPSMAQPPARLDVPDLLEELEPTRRSDSGVKPKDLITLGASVVKLQVLRSMPKNGMLYVAAVEQEVLARPLQAEKFLFDRHYAQQNHRM